MPALNCPHHRNLIHRISMLCVENNKSKFKWKIVRALPMDSIGDVWERDSWDSKAIYFIQHKLWEIGFAWKSLSLSLSLAVCVISIDRLIWRDTCKSKCTRENTFLDFLVRRFLRHLNAEIIFQPNSTVYTHLINWLVRWIHQNLFQNIFVFSFFKKKNIE